MDANPVGVQARLARSDNVEHHSRCDSAHDLGEDVGKNVCNLGASSRPEPDRDCATEMPTKCDRPLKPRSVWPIRMQSSLPKTDAERGKPAASAALSNISQNVPKKSCPSYSPIALAVLLILAREKVVPETVDVGLAQRVRRRYDC